MEQIFARKVSLYFTGFRLKVIRKHCYENLREKTHRFVQVFFFLLFQKLYVWGLYSLIFYGVNVTRNKKGREKSWIGVKNVKIYMS